MTQIILSALVVGTVTAVLGTGRITLSLLISTTLIWSWIPIVQVMTGLLFIRGARMARRAALARYFQTGRYWSAWTLSFALVLLLVPNPFAFLTYLILTAVFPAVLTAHALVAAAMDICGDSPDRARRRMLLHQGVTYAILVSYFGWAVALWPRIAALVRA